MHFIVKKLHNNDERIYNYISQHQICIIYIKSDQENYQG